MLLYALEPSGLPVEGHTLSSTSRHNGWRAQRRLSSLGDLACPHGFGFIYMNQPCG
jgi:hypothetical protein